MTSLWIQRRVRLALCILALTASSCADEDPTAATDSATSPAAEGAADAPDQLFDTQFAQVCRDTGQTRAAAYAAGPGVHPVLVLTSDDGTDYHASSVTLPDGWSASWPDLGRTELVACARRVSATPGRVCDGYEDDDSGQTWSVQVHDVTYTYDVRNARTAEVLGQTTFDVPAGSCPMLTMYSEGDPQPKPYYPSAGAGEVELFLRPYVTGS